MSRRWTIRKSSEVDLTSHSTEHNLEAATRFLTPDWVGDWPALDTGRGHEGFKRLPAAYLQAFPDVKIQVEDAMTDGDRVMRRVSWTGTHYGTYLGLAASGRAVRGEGIDSFR